MMTQSIKYLRLCLLPGLACLLTVACTSAPVQEMSDARQAVAAARAAGAAQRTPLQLDAAEQSLRQAQEQLQQYQYREARKRAETAKALAVKARHEAVEQRQHEQQRTLEITIAELRQTLRTTIALGGPVAETQALLQSAEVAIQLDDYAKAEQQVAAAKQQVPVGLNQAYLHKARALVAAAKSRRHLSTRQRATVRKTEAALRKNAGKQAYDLINSL